MQILRMRATFGKLNGAELTLDSGLNVIVAPNESGKSTWCAFIRAMLYGIDTSEREKGGVKPDKIKYAPWSGAPMEGEMDILWQGKAITLTRRTKTANAPMKQFSAVYTGTNEPVPELTAQNAGLVLTGAEKAVFERSAFIRQGAIGVTNSPELSKKIAAIVSTGEEDTSWAETDATLRGWQRKRRYNRRGELPETEGKIEEIRRELAACGDERERHAALGAELRRLETERQTLTRQVEESRKRQRKAALERLSENKNALRQAQSAYEQAELAARQCEEKTDASRFAGMRPEAAVQKAEEDAARAGTLVRAANGQNSPVLWVLLAVLALVALGCALLLEPLLLIAFVLFALGAVLSLCRWKKRKDAFAEAGAASRALLEDYGAAAPGDITAQAAAYAALCGELKAALEKRDAAKAALDTVTAAQTELDAGLLNALNFDSGDNEAARLGQALRRTEEQMARLRDTQAELGGRLQAAGDPLVLESALETLEARRDELELQYEALELAVRVLSESNTEIQTRFSPMLSRQATAYLARLTDGRYAGLQLDKELTAAVRRPEDAAAREAAFLSAGALDQMYLALRLAICKLTLGGEEACPIILDDALVNFDAGRCVNALELLGEIAAERQIVLFSCRENAKTKSE